MQESNLREQPFTNGNASEEAEKNEPTLLHAQLLQSDKVLVQMAAGELAKYVCRSASEAHDAIAQEGQQSEAAWTDIHYSASNIRKVSIICLLEFSLAGNHYRLSEV